MKKTLAELEITFGPSSEGGWFFSVNLLGREKEEYKEVLAGFFIEALKNFLFPGESVYCGRLNAWENEVLGDWLNAAGVSPLILGRGKPKGLPFFKALFFDPEKIWVFWKVQELEMFREVFEKFLFCYGGTWVVTVGTFGEKWLIPEFVGKIKEETKGDWSDFVERQIKFTDLLVLTIDDEGLEFQINDKRRWEVARKWLRLNVKSKNEFGKSVVRVPVTIC